MVAKGAVVLRSEEIFSLSETTGARIWRITRDRCCHRNIWKFARACTTSSREAASDQEVLSIIGVAVPTLRHNKPIHVALGIGETCDVGHVIEHVTCGDTMIVRAADAWSIARFCALVAKEADDDIMCRSLINIRDVWIEIANECELLGTREERAARVVVTSGTAGPVELRARIAAAFR